MSYPQVGPAYSWLASQTGVTNKDVCQAVIAAHGQHESAKVPLATAAAAVTTAVAATADVVSEGS